MKSNIVFFDSFENSKRGTLRGAVLVPLLALMWWGWHAVLMKKEYDKHIDTVSKQKIWVGFIVCGFLIVSALGVHNPDTAKKAAMYGALVGLVIYGCSNAVLLACFHKWDYEISIIDTMFGVISMAVLGYFLYIIVKKYPDVLAPV